MDKEKIESFKANVKASFDANPKSNHFHVDENGHCFAWPQPNTKIVTRVDFFKEEEPVSKKKKTTE